MLFLISNNVSMKKFSFIKIFIVILLLISVWAFLIEPEIITVKHYRLNNEKLAGIRVVFVSDLHLKKSHQSKLKKIVYKINKQKPDIVLFGGDFVNHDSDDSLDIEKMAFDLSSIESRYGVYSILGNHDRWFGAEKLKKVLERNNIKVLVNSMLYTDIGTNRIYIAGIDDLMMGSPDINKTLKNVHSPVILMSHSPDIFPDVPKFVDLTLAGHTHGGQVVIPFRGPFWVPSDYGSRYASGFVVEDSKKMIVTKGIGTSIIPVRFNCLPEIVVIDFE